MHTIFVSEYSPSHLIEEIDSLLFDFFMQIQQKPEEFHLTLRDDNTLLIQRNPVRFLGFPVSWDEKLLIRAESEYGLHNTHYIKGILRMKGKRVRITNALNESVLFFQTEAPFYQLLDYLRRMAINKRKERWSKKADKDIKKLK
ncbi:MAG: hypothetical protein UU77_C0031G0009 [candidate division WWE3 bacterium GW2011_GWC1_41_7]|uniref:Uncharacterized protein n=4 Tax=Katanobacteria TaxID=422282 RepID=A0A0G0ZDL3_UNCKA|nr:MAG: hypothetical protein UU72_C0024G0017 [candidate division WWE3 bacterium GW2011_GWB1_41_6]KKS20126.1 MAG: hypothetical protein UU77_C0031G0009 [candidate division WWE3 bacterium GW2011_GWC1_41_7]KKS22143.1 MAG: hypothetical protein UU80_C0013G0037 [candidate division WWE3 bacterium GW2011_GWA1_41_8]OGC57835.1 MAG: hypothetical protein A2976_01955 [candidate division WWE3 bacterium RIFCSPLOWO2_01_FULL_41_9]